MNCGLSASVIGFSLESLTRVWLSGWLAPGPCVQLGVSLGLALRFRRLGWVGLFPTHLRSDDLEVTQAVFFFPELHRRSAVVRPGKPRSLVIHDPVPQGDDFFPSVAVDLLEFSNAVSPLVQIDLLGWKSAHHRIRHANSELVVVRLEFVLRGFLG